MSRLSSGVLVLAGDDTACKSSTIPGDSTISLFDLSIPVLYPGDPAEVLEFGLHGIALSRYAGLWTGLKIVTNVADGGAVIDLPHPRPPILPDFDIGGRRFEKQLDMRLLPPYSIELERQIFSERTAAALAYVHANGLDSIRCASPGDRIGLVAAGKPYRDLRLALELLGLDEAALDRHGIRVLKLGCIAPVEPRRLREFAQGLEEIIVVEDKRGFVETQIRQVLYNLPDRPLVGGKETPGGETLFPMHGELEGHDMARILGTYLEHRLPGAAPAERLAHLRAGAESAELATKLPAALPRTPYFCSGCPHNTSTQLPEGSDVAGGGIGCHAMAMWMDRGVSWLPQMGGEGACWIGLAPFTEQEHVFQNVGDGTYAHSASKAIEACIAADLHMTFRILYNSAVAMTGGQDAVGLLSSMGVARQLQLQGMKRVVLVTEDLERFPHRDDNGVEIRHRRDYDQVLKELRAIKGPTAVVYDQQCAAEKRRERKRGIQETPSQRVYINPAVCEGCGDCAAKSNCLSVAPLETEYGRKTQIHQSSCNLDYSCIDGDCPAFMTVELGKGTKPVRRAAAAPLGEDEVPEPSRQLPDDATFRALLVGIGGTGVVTVDAILVTAALMEGRYAVHLDQTGLAQKGGAVVSNLLLSRGPIPRANKLGDAEADLALSFDLLATIAPDNLKRFSQDTTAVVGNTAGISPAAVITDSAARMPPLDELRKRLALFTDSDRSYFVDAEAATERLLGNSVTGNIFLVGAAYQGLLPLQARFIEQALVANGVAVEDNIQAFRYGRLSVAAPERFRRAAGLAEPEAPTAAAAADAARERLERWAPNLGPKLDALLAAAPRGGSLDRLLPGRVADLLLYGGGFAERYLGFVGEVADAEESKLPGHTAVREAAARYGFKLLAVKDEYEVARLWIQDPTWDQVSRDYDGSLSRQVLLHPPTLRRFGWKRKIRLGAWSRSLFRLLYAVRGLRGTALDIFGATRHRRLERGLFDWYRGLVHGALERLDSNAAPAVVELAELPDSIRGYEGVKERTVASARSRARQLQRQLDEEPAGSRVA
ncbi:MAG: indolepyruvate ferredoxin oxidoreductase family protein [Acidobacteriota bacterium]|nr:indolepyruvate ferredoxin oxidoreductase family protein [Acidobacteriota bacterium]